jgi:hypothetical protein
MNHSQSHDHGHTHGHAHGHAHGPGHNHAPEAAQWQTPHLPDGHHHQGEPREADVDLVEAAFVEGFRTATDITSYLRLASIPFVGTAADGSRLGLLRVETDIAADVASLTPRVGGGGLNHAPLPAKLVSRRETLRFVYHDGETLRPLTFAEARALTDETPAR